MADNYKRIVKLIMVTGDNNNKYYDMFDLGNGQMKVNYGRVGTTSNDYFYPISEWDSKLRSKTKKGYKDVTHIFQESAAPTTVTTSSGKKIQTSSNGLKPEIQKFMDELQGYSNKSIQTNYLVSSENVTQKQVDTAQELVNQLTTFTKIGVSYKDINKILLEIYSIIPRKMVKVQHHLLDSNITKTNLPEFERLISNEQQTLDVMAQQVNQIAQTNVASSDPKVKNILEIMGLEMEVVDAKEIAMIKKLLGSNSRQFVKAFKVKNLRTQNKFDTFVKNAKNQRKELFWHGSRNENWLSILDSGLKLRPTGAVITGKMFGYGTYFADKAQKSIGYTSLRGSYFARGSSNKAYLALFDVHIGNWFHVLGRNCKYSSHSSWMYDLNESKLKSYGDYDSLFAEGGADLRNNEYIVYNENQTTVSYIVEISD